LPVLTDRQCDVDVLRTHFDEKSHDHPAYRQLLLNSLTWVSQK
jgi:hypothetical protein